MADKSFVVLGSCSEIFVDFGSEDGNIVEVQGTIRLPGGSIKQLDFRKVTHLQRTWVSSMCFPLIGTYVLEVIGVKSDEGEVIKPKKLYEVCQPIPYWAQMMGFIKTLCSPCINSVLHLAKGSGSDCNTCNKC